MAALFSYELLFVFYLRRHKIAIHACIRLYFGGHSFVPFSKYEKKVENYLSLNIVIEKSKAARNKSCKSKVVVVSAFSRLPFSFLSFLSKAHPIRLSVMSKSLRARWKHAETIEDRLKCPWANQKVRIRSWRVASLSTEKRHKDKNGNWARKIAVFSKCRQLKEKERRFLFPLNVIVRILKLHFFCFGNWNATFQARQKRI